MKESITRFIVSYAFIVLWSVTILHNVCDVLLMQIVCTSEHTMYG